MTTKLNNRGDAETRRQIFKLGDSFTRDEIAAELGGSAIDFLPMVGGKVVCACLRLDLNPEAPKIILPGFGPQIESSAAALCEQRGPIPVFIKQRTNAWQYSGEFIVERCSTNAEEIREQERNSGRSGREGISRIIFMKEASNT